MMTPENRLATVLFGSFLLWLPALDAMMSDELEPGAAGIRYGAAVVFVWAAVRIVERIVHGYVTPPVEAEAPAADPDDDGALDAGLRRREDTEAASTVEPEVAAGVAAR